MLYAILCYSTEAAVRAWTREEDDAVIARLAVVEQRLAAEGKLGPNVRLMPTSAATTLRVGGEPLVTDGPFAETKEQLLGFWVLDCATREEAIEATRLLAQARAYGRGAGALEIRPIATYDRGSGVK